MKSLEELVNESSKQIEHYIEKVIMSRIREGEDVAIFPSNSITKKILTEANYCFGEKDDKIIVVLDPKVKEIVIEN
jgi:glutathionylspermidine synthase